MTRNLQRAFSQLDTSKKDRDYLIPAMLGFMIQGQETVEVAARPGYVYVRIRSNLNEVIQVYNDKVSPVYDLPVLLIRDPNNPTRYKIDGRDVGRYENWATTSSYLPRHGNQHSFNPEGGGGGDITWIYSKQFMPLALFPSGTAGSPVALIGGGAYYQDDIWRYAGNTGTSPLTTYNPTGSFARMVLISLNSIGNPQYTAGTYFSPTITGTAQVMGYVPTVPADSVPIGAVRLVSGTSAVLWENIYDARLWGQGGGGGGAPASHASQHEHGGTDELVLEKIDMTEQILLFHVGSSTFAGYTASNANLQVALDAVQSNDILYLPKFDFEGSFTLSGSATNPTIIGQSTNYISNYDGDPAFVNYCQGLVIRNVNFYVEGTLTGTVAGIVTEASYLYYRDVTVLSANYGGPCLAVKNSSGIQELYGYCYFEAYNDITGGYVPPFAVEPRTPYFTRDEVSEDVGIRGLYNRTGSAANAIRVNENGLTSEGTASIRPRYSTANVSNPPTDAELDSALGQPAARGAGYMALINDAGGGTNEYLVVSDGTNWFYSTLTKAT